MLTVSTLTYFKNECYFDLCECLCLYCIYVFTALHINILYLLRNKLQKDTKKHQENRKLKQLISIDSIKAIRYHKPDVSIMNDMYENRHLLELTWNDHKVGI